MLPLAGPFVDSTPALEAIGGPAGRGCALVYFYQPSFDHPQNNTFVEMWHEQWSKWKEPYDSASYMCPGASVATSVVGSYWLFDVIQRAGSLDPEKIIQTWEGDEYQSITGAVLKMRACDHQTVMDLYVSRLDFPTKWQSRSASYTKSFVVPARFCLPPVAEGLERCKK